jgi:2-desacetyl-2-hydroxyethyl bacteriochlorophyllide A dehydrogenase
MRRAVLGGPGDLTVVDAKEPEPRRGEVLVKVAACGICGSDLHAFNGEHPLVIYPVTPGHEFSGTIVAAGEGADPGLVGRNACVEPSLVCGTCPQCVSGRYNICGGLRVMGFQAPGAMCGFIAVPVDRLHMLPEDVGLEAGALAEPAAVGVHALGRSGVEPGASILIVGAGVIGLMVLKVAKALGCRVAVVEGSAERAERAIGFGADEAVVFPDALAQPADRGFDAVFECVGRAETIDLAVRAAPRGGTVVAVGVAPGPVPVPMPLVQDGEIDIRGTLMYTGADFERAIELIRSGAITPGEFVTHRVTLDELERGYELAGMAGPETLKVLVEIGEGN